MALYLNMVLLGQTDITYAWYRSRSSLAAYSAQAYFLHTLIHQILAFSLINEGVAWLLPNKLVDARSEHVMRAEGWYCDSAPMHTYALDRHTHMQYVSFT